jgi:hypothetical protein
MKKIGFFLSLLNRLNIHLGKQRSLLYLVPKLITNYPQLR